MKTEKYEDIYQMSNDEIAEACEQAADMIEGHWVQGTWFQYYMPDEETGESERWAYCIEGGLAAALGLDTITEVEDSTRKELLACPVYNAVLKTLNQDMHRLLVDMGRRREDEYLPCYGEGDLPNWNDNDERREQEVLDLLRSTAKRVLTEVDDDPDA